MVVYRKDRKFEKLTDVTMRHLEDLWKELCTRSEADPEAFDFYGEILGTDLDYEENKERIKSHPAVSLEAAKMQFEESMDVEADIKRKLEKAEKQLEEAKTDRFWERSERFRRERDKFKKELKEAKATVERVKRELEEFKGKRPVEVVFLEDIKTEFRGTDGILYGPFKKGEKAFLPIADYEKLFLQKIVEKVKPPKKVEWTHKLERKLTDLFKSILRAGAPELRVGPLAPDRFLPMLRTEFEIIKALGTEKDMEEYVERFAKDILRRHGKPVEKIVEKVAPPIPRPPGVPTPVWGRVVALPYERAMRPAMAKKRCPRCPDGIATWIQMTNVENGVKVIKGRWYCEKCGWKSEWEVIGYI